MDAHGFSSAGPNGKALTIKIGGSSGDKSAPISPTISISPNLNSPSPPSSAFVSALQSPYISPRATQPPTDCNPAPAPLPTIPSPTSHSDDIPSTSYTQSSERDDFTIDLTDHKPKFSDAAPPRISFSFPVTRISLTKSSLSPSPNAKLRSCDVYIGFHGQNPNLMRFCKWLKSELELQGIASFVSDRAKYSDTQSHEIADRIICSATFGVVVVTPLSFLCPFSVEEIRIFAQKKNLIPLLFDTEPSEILSFLEMRLEDKECREAFEGFTKSNQFKLEANESNWRCCVSRSVAILRSKLGRKSIGEKETNEFEELPFPRNKFFVGREELTEIEAAFFGCSDVQEAMCAKALRANGFADEDMKRCKELTLEAWIEPTVDLTSKGRSNQKLRSKHKKGSIGGNKAYNSSNVVCITGISGIGKTELALEFAHRYFQRYKMVLWIGGEARYFRQNILNLSMNLGLDVSAEAEKDSGRMRSFDEQEFDAFQRVKRELFRDVPYLLIIDNLETEKEWWEGKDLHDLIPRNTGATHVIITTRLSKVMSFEAMQLPPLSLTDSLMLIRGKRKKDYQTDEMEILEKIDQKLGRLSFGLCLIGSLLSELVISPSALFEAIESISLDDNWFSLGFSDDGFLANNPFLVKLLIFCFAVLDRAKGRRSLALRMALAGAWFAPAPISSTLLAAAANKLPSKRRGFRKWRRCLSTALFCGSSYCIVPRARKSEVESATMLVKLGLAKRTTRQPGCWIQFHPITQMFARRRGGLPPVKAAVHATGRIGNAVLNSDHLWASAFLVFGFKSEPPLVQLKAVDTVLFIKKTALPLAIRSFMTFSRCNSALELLKVSTNVLDEVEKSFVSQIQDWPQGSLCWKKKLQPNQRVDEYVWQDVTLLKATLLETRAKLLLRGGQFDSGEELCRTCISIRTVMLGHNHAHTLAAQETLAKLVRYRSKT